MYWVQVQILHHGNNGKIDMRAILTTPRKTTAKTRKSTEIIKVELSPCLQAVNGHIGKTNTHQRVACAFLLFTL